MDRVLEQRTSPLAQRASVFPGSVARDERGSGVAGHSGAPVLRRLLPGLDEIIGHAGGLRHIVGRARLLANVDATVLLEGETGVGKDVLAHAIHDAGPRRAAPFVAINCGALTRELLESELFGYVEGAFTGARRSGMPGKLESADGGTLFLDEIAEMPLELQPYLLRVLEDGEVCRVGSRKPSKVSFRLIAACNRDLRSEVAEKRFRRDLFYRISVVSLHVPPLRERREDLPALVQHFAEQAARRSGTPPKTFSQSALAAFERYAWPGNVRELRNVVEAMSLFTEGNVVTEALLPDPLRDGAEAPPSSSTCSIGSRKLQQLERDAITAAMLARRGNVSQAARELDIARSTLYLKIKRYGLEALLDEARLAQPLRLTSSSG